MKGILEQIAADLEWIKERLKDGPPPKQPPLWIAQRDENGRDSPLGRRNHCAAVRRRKAEGLDGAERVGKRYLLSPEALQEELALRSAGTARASPRDEGGDVYTRMMQLAGSAKGNTR